jgi:hypothetical protein
VLGTLHSGHQGFTSMLARGMASVWWPRVKEDVTRVREACREYDLNAPSQQKEPTVESVQPEYPLQLVCAYYLAMAGHQYLVLVDRYSGWPSVHHVKGGGTAKEFVRVLQNHYETFGIMEQLTTDGGPQFVAAATQEFLDVWGIEHRLSSNYEPHGNTRAKVGVKTIKRLMRSNLGHGGTLDTVKMGRALLEYTPKHHFKLLWALRRGSVTILWALKRRSFKLVWALRRRSMTILWALRRRSATVQRALRLRSMTVLRALRRRSMTILWALRRRSATIQRALRKMSATVLRALWRRSIIVLGALRRRSKIVLGAP